MSGGGAAEESTGLSDLFGEASLGADLALLARIPAEGIGGYRAVRLLGSGGEGAVFEARGDDGSVVALKVVRVEPGAGPRAERLRRSFEALRELDHPVVVRARGFVPEKDGIAALAMELVEGVDLRVHLTDAGPLAPIRAIEVAAAVARALAHCHERGVLHCDVKPRNVIVRPSGVPTLVDFGNTRDARAAAFTRSFEVKGTIGFMAPEQFMPGSRLDARTDVFGLGMTLHVLIAGRFRGTERPDARPEIAAALVRAGPRAQAIDAERLAEAIARATELDPAARFQTAAAFADELEAVLRGGRAARRRPRSRRAAIVAAIAAAVVSAAAAVAAVVLLSSRGASYRIDMGRGIVFLDAAGREVGAEPIDFSGVANVEAVNPRSRGDLLAIAPYRENAPGEIHLFDVRRARRVEGWERPLVLSEGGGGEAPWAPLDPYDAEGHYLRMSGAYLEDLEGDGRPEVLVLGHGSTWATCALIRVDLDRRIGGAYFQFGTFVPEELVDVDGDGRLDAVCRGVNNDYRFDEDVGSHPPVVFAVSGTAFARGGPRCEGPPGRPGIANGYDAPLLFYQLLPPSRCGGRVVNAWPVPPDPLRWRAAEERFAYHGCGDGDFRDLAFRYFFDRRGRHVRTDLNLDAEAQTRRLGAVTEVSAPIPVVVGGERQPAPGTVIERENQGVRAYLVRLGRAPAPSPGGP